MRKKLRIAGLALACLAALVLVSGILLQLFFGATLKELVVKTVNERLDAPLALHGDVSFSVFRSFPYMSVDFNGVELKEGIIGSDKNLLVAERVSLQFNVMSVIGGNYNIRRVRIINARLATVIDEKGKANYFVFKKSNDTTVASTLSIDHIDLQNVQLVHNDIYNSQSYAALIHEGTARGDFGASRFITEAKMDLLVQDAIVDGVPYLNNKLATLDLALDINLDENIYAFNRCKLAVSEAAFLLSGSVAQTAKGYVLDLALSGDDVGLEELGSLLPSDYYAPIQSMRTRGDLSCTGTVKGLISKKQNPAVTFTFGIRNGTLKTEDGQTLNDVNLSAEYSNGESKTWNGSRLVIRDAKLSFDDQPFACSLEMTRFDRPHLDMRVNGLVDLATVKPFIGLNEDAVLDGTVQLVNFTYRGAAKALGSKTNIATQSEGMLVLKNVRYRDSGIDVETFNGTLVSNGNALRIQQCNATINETELAISGELQNMIPALFAGLEKSPVTFDLSLHTPQLDVASFNLESTGSKDSSVNKNWWRHFNGRAVCSVLDFRYDDFNARNVETTVSIKDGLVKFNGLRFAALDGNVKADGSLDLRKDNVQILEATLACDNVDVTTLFESFDDFGQSDFTSNNIAGTLHARCFVTAVWRNGAFDANALVAVADVALDKGELNKFEPMQALSKFARVDDLNNIRFSKLSNQIEIRNGIVHIPSTTIRSNVMTVELSGTHTLENFIDYKLKLNLSELVGKKFKKSSTFDPEAAEAAANGTFNLYVTMKGPAGNPTITYDKRAVKESVQYNLAQEKQDLKNVLQREFTKRSDPQRPAETVKDWEAPVEYELIDFDANADDAE